MEYAERSTSFYVSPVPQSRLKKASMMCGVVRIRRDRLTAKRHETDSSGMAYARHKVTTSQLSRFILHVVLLFLIVFQCRRLLANVITAGMSQLTDSLFAAVFSSQMLDILLSYCTTSTCSTYIPLPFILPFSGCFT